MGKEYSKLEKKKKKSKPTLPFTWVFYPPSQPAYRQTIKLINLTFLKTNDPIFVLV